MLTHSSSLRTRVGLSTFEHEGAEAVVGTRETRDSRSERGRKLCGLAWSRRCRSSSGATICSAASLLARRGSCTAPSAASAAASTRSSSQQRCASRYAESGLIVAGGQRGSRPVAECWRLVCGRWRPIAPMHTARYIVCSGRPRRDVGPRRDRRDRRHVSIPRDGRGLQPADQQLADAARPEPAPPRCRMWYRRRLARRRWRSLSWCRPPSAQRPGDGSRSRRFRTLPATPRRAC